MIKMRIKHSMDGGGNEYNRFVRILSLDIYHIIDILYHMLDSSIVSSDDNIRYDHMDNYVLYIYSLIYIVIDHNNTHGDIHRPTQGNLSAKLSSIIHNSNRIDSIKTLYNKELILFNDMLSI